MPEIDLQDSDRKLLEEMLGIDAGLRDAHPQRNAFETKNFSQVDDMNRLSRLGLIEFAGLSRISAHYRVTKVGFAALGLSLPCRHNAPDSIIFDKDEPFASATDRAQEYRQLGFK